LLLVVGLGNPGPQYARTRHNCGFMAVDRAATRLGLGWRRARFGALVARYTPSRGPGEPDRPVTFVKPLSFMNASGPVVRQAMSRYGVDLSELLVVFDDLDLPAGKLRLRPRGSAGGHHGVESIIASLQSDDFARLRLGIGRPPPGVDPVDYVLSAFDEPAPEIEAMIDTAAEAILMWAKDGLEAAMNFANRG